MSTNRNVHGTSHKKGKPGSRPGLPLSRKALLPAAVLGLVLAGCTAQEEPEAASSKPASPSASAEEPARPSSSAGEPGTNGLSLEIAPNATQAPGTEASPNAAQTPDDPAVQALFRADNPVSVETFFQQQPQWRPANASVVLEESGSGTGTFELPAMEPGTSFTSYLTCNQPGAYDIEVLDDESDHLSTVGSDHCNVPMLMGFEHVIMPGENPASITVDGPDGDYWLVVYHLPSPVTAPAAG